MNQVIAVVWEWVDRPGLESASVRLTDGALQMDGVAATVLDSAPLRFRYGMLTDSNGEVRDVSIRVELQGATTTVRLVRGPSGWTVDGCARPDLAECIDIDIMGSPSTNSLPIRRMAWTPGEGRDFRMAYISLPDLAVTPMVQRYTYLGGLASDHTGPVPAVPGLRRFEYLSVASGFRAEIIVDEHDLVVDYPPYWRRRQSGA
jgi:uncharacterized protein